MAACRYHQPVHDTQLLVVHTSCVDVQFVAHVGACIVRLCCVFTAWFRQVSLSAVDITECVCLQGCLFTTNINTAIRISDAMETGTVQVNAAPSRGPDHFPFQGFRDSGIGSQGIINSLAMMVRDKSTVINLDKPSYTMG